MIHMDRHGAIWGCNMTPEGIQRTRQSCWPMTVARPHTVETCCNDMGPNSTKKHAHLSFNNQKISHKKNAKVSDVRNFFRPWHMWRRDTIQLFLWMVDRNGIFWFLWCSVLGWSGGIRCGFDAQNHKVRMFVGCKLYSFTHLQDWYGLVINCAHVIFWDMAYLQHPLGKSLGKPYCQVNGLKLRCTWRHVVLIYMYTTYIYIYIGILSDVGEIYELAFENQTMHP